MHVICDVFATGVNATVSKCDAIDSWKLKKLFMLDISSVCSLPLVLILNNVYCKCAYKNIYMLEKEEINK